MSRSRMLAPGIGEIILMALYRMLTRELGAVLLWSIVGLSASVIVAVSCRSDLAGFLDTLE